MSELVAGVPEKLGEEAARMGPLDSHAPSLVHLAYALDQLSDGAVHSHGRRGLFEGISAAKLEHVGMLAAATLGEPLFLECFGY